MKVYFAGAIKGGREKQQEYYELIRYINNFAQVLTEFVGNKNTDIENETKFSEKENEHVYIRDTRLINECDIVIADVTVPSLGVGYELGYAESKGKEIICLYDNNSNKELSYMISGNNKNKVFYYNTLDEAKDIIKNYFNNLNSL